MNAVGGWSYGRSCGPETDKLGGLPECILALEGDAMARKSSILSSFGPASSVVYFFGLLFRHLLIPNPMSTNTASATSMMATRPMGMVTICRELILGQMAPSEQLNGSTEPLGQKVPAGHAIWFLPPGGQ